MTSALKEWGGTGLANQSAPKLFAQTHHRSNANEDSPTYPQAQAKMAARLRAIDQRAAAIAHTEAVKSAKAALHCTDPAERAELRLNAGLLFGWAKSLNHGGAR